MLLAVQGWCAFFLQHWAEAARFLDQLIYQDAVPGQDSLFLSDASPVPLSSPSEGASSSGSDAEGGPVWHEDLEADRSSKDGKDDSKEGSKAPATKESKESKEAKSSAAVVEADETADLPLVIPLSGEELTKALSSRRRVVSAKASVQGLYCYHVGLCYAVLGEFEVGE